MATRHSRWISFRTSVMRRGSSACGLPQPRISTYRDWGLDRLREYRCRSAVEEVITKALRGSAAQAGRGRRVLGLTCCWLATGLAACDTTLRGAAIVAPVDPPGPDPVQEPTDVKYYPSDEPVRMGLEQFNRGNYGIAQRYFKDSVEKSPRDVTAWIGLAASYDRLRRFDLADQAYVQAIRLGGETVQILNIRTCCAAI